MNEVRRYHLEPSEVIYLGDIGDSGGTEGVALLSETMPVRSSHFQLESFDFTNVEGADPSAPWHMVAQKNGTRTVTTTVDELDLLHLKMTLFWTRKLPKDGKERAKEIAARLLRGC